MILNTFILILLLGCANNQPLISNIKIKITHLCTVNGTRAPKWVCKKGNKTGHSYYIVGEYQPPKVKEYNKIGRIKINKHHHIDIKEVKEQSIYGNLFIPIEKYNNGAINNAKQKLQQKFNIKNKALLNNYQIIYHWINPDNGNYYALVKFN